MPTSRPPSVTGRWRTLFIRITLLASVSVADTSTVAGSACIHDSATPASGLRLAATESTSSRSVMMPIGASASSTTSAEPTLRPRSSRATWPSVAERATQTRSRVITSATVGTAAPSERGPVRARDLTLQDGVEPDGTAGRELADTADREQRAGHERLPAGGVVPDRERLPERAQDHRLVGDEARQADGRDLRPRRAGALDQVGREPGGAA